MKHKSGFVNIIGNPNVGKSTLLNAFMGDKLSIITNKAQTTRHRILGILNTEEYQIVFSDTPGVLKPAYALQEHMMGFVKTALEDADILIYLIELGEKSLKDEALFKRINNAEVPVLLLINKIDLADEQSLSEALMHWTMLLPKAEIFAISALENFGVQEALNRIVELLPEGPAYYDKEQFTDKPERFFVNESIREKILMHYKKEIPYSVEVVTEDFLESEDIIRIRSVIMVERETQKGIIIGHKGSAIKRVGIEARKDLEKFFDKKIHLELYVKVSKDWRMDDRSLRRFGYQDY